MRLYNQTHAFYAGVDLHARTMLTHVLDQRGRTVWCRAGHRKREPSRRCEPSADQDRQTVLLGEHEPQVFGGELPQRLVPKPVAVGDDVGRVRRLARALFMTCYAARLRINEACYLQVADLDSQRMLIHVRHAKRAVRSGTRCCGRGCCRYFVTTDGWRGRPFGCSHGGTQAHPMSDNAQSAQHEGQFFG